MANCWVEGMADGPGLTTVMIRQLPSDWEACCFKLGSMLSRLLLWVPAVKKNSPTLRTPGALVWFASPKELATGVLIKTGRLAFCGSRGQYTQLDLFGELMKRGFKATFDFLYLPLDAKKGVHKALMSFFGSRMSGDVLFDVCWGGLDTW